MNYRYGLELECFYSVDGMIQIPPKEFPVDGFPGLIELRTDGHHTLEGAFAKLYEVDFRLPQGNLMFICEHKFTPAEKRELRKRHWIKDTCDIQSLYGKKPKDLRGKTIASLQINISNLVRSSFKDDKGVYHSDQFSLLDIPRIVRALDQEFESEIKVAKRQLGEYCVKGDRLEYRSLPNSVWSFLTPKQLIKRIRKVVEGDK